MTSAHCKLLVTDNLHHWLPAYSTNMSPNTRLWSPANPGATRMEQFRTHVNRKYNLDLKDYAALWKWSVTDIESFWSTVWEFCGVKASAPWTEILEKDKRMDEIPKWFKGAKLNYAENLLSRRDEHVALIGVDEREEVRRMTYNELYTMVRDCAAALRNAEVTVGDRVVGYVPNSPETVAIMLATASIGAIWSSASPDFGVTGVLERFTQISPKVLFSVDKVYYNGRVHDHLSKVQDVAKGLPSLEHVVIFPFDNQSLSVDTSAIANAKTYSTFVERSNTTGKDIVFEQLPFNHPLAILYSSGTTGKPKCIVHSAGGVLLQHLKEHLLHGNMSQSDVYFYYADYNWMDDVELAH